MISINELVEEALAASGINDVFRKNWKKNTKLTKKGSIVNTESQEKKDTSKKKGFEKNFKSFEDLKNHMSKKEDKDDKHQ